tara:strand:- start:3307 stop:5067 length:1761 start_codon:yes stop_codon:yes gene_type:complete
MSKKIGIENFRVFKEYTEFEIRPITLLTGPNNSGKSSFTKLLLLLKNQVNPLNFDSGDHNLESFEKILNWDSNDDTLTIGFKSSMFFGEEGTLKLHYTYKKIEKLEVFHHDNLLISVSFFPFQEDSDGLYMMMQKSVVKFNIKILIDIIYSKNFYVAQRAPGINSNGDLSKDWGITKLKDIDLSKNKTQTLNLKNLREKFEEIKPEGNSDISFLLSNIALWNEINSLDKNYLLIRCKVRDKDITEIYKNELLKIQMKLFENFEVTDSANGNESFKEIIGGLKLQVSSLFKDLFIHVKNFFYEEFNINDLEVSYSQLGNLLFNVPVFRMSSENKFRYYDFTVMDEILQLDQEDFGMFQNLHFISSNRANQKRVLQNKSDSEIDALILQYSELQFPDLDFFNQGLKILGIEGKLIIERYQNFISVVYLKNEKSKIALSDLGYGYSQILPVLLKIIIIMNNQLFPGTTHGSLIIEEPEANLHPNLQSKLADIFLLAIETFPRLDLIVETHSEYLIRKLQYLTAKKELGTDKSVIYYFNSDKYVTSQEPKVKKIEITKTGNLTDTFGPGFYDESIRLQFDLMKLNQEQNN